MAKKPIGTFAVISAAVTAYVVGAHVIPRMIPQPDRSEIDHAIGWIVVLAMLALLGCVLFYLLRARYRARSD
jgi:cytochrome c oxidase assembly factor CtaG